jgi:uridine kinase
MVDAPDTPDHPDRHALRPEWAPFADALRDAVLAVRDPRAHGRTVVGVAGESGSGKSLTATGLVRALRALGVAAGALHQDDYFVRPPRANHAHRVADIASVGPQEVDLARLAAHVAAFRRGEAVEGPVVHYGADRFDVRRHDFAPLAALVVEGTYALLLDDLDVRVFLTATHADTHARRVARGRDADDPFVERVVAIEHALIAPQAARADLLVDGAFRLAPGPRRGGVRPA